MADNFTTNAGSGGDTFAADDVAGVKYPFSKIDIGGDGVASPLSASNPMPVTGGLTDAQLRATAVPISGALTNEVSRVYVRRGKKVLFFNTPEEADAYLIAEQQADEAIQKAQKTSKRAKKRLKDKIYPAAASIDLIELERLTVRFDLPYDLPKMYEAQQWDKLAFIAERLRQMQDEEEIELLLLA